MSLILGCVLSGKAQKVERFNAFGLQYRPILPMPILNNWPLEADNERIGIRVDPQLGHDFGAVIRWGIGERFAIETGIDQIRRNFSIRVEDKSTGYVDRIRFGMLNYQIPLRALFYVQIGDRLFTNVAAGAVGDVFPTDWSVSEGRSSQYTQRFNWLIGGFTASVGMEYRTENSGSLYLGSTYHRPFGNAPKFTANIAAMRVQYRESNRIYEETLTVPGEYLTLDLKYFFPRSGDQE